MMILFAATMAALAVWFRSTPVRPCSLPTHNEEDPTTAGMVLVVELLRVAVAQGISIPLCLIAVGDTIGGDSGAQLTAVGAKLNHGCRWQEAWRAAANLGTEASALLEVLEDALEPSWTHGVSPVERLKLTAEQLGQEELSDIERKAGRLTVRLLVPTGLCFLPAFVCIGVIPAIASFAW